ncbi:MAG: Tad domain-containing protein, partial [Erythrobacter sp.]|nr:Tad domain-containing protein [Erythrobacter sp.]
MLPFFIGMVALAVDIAFVRNEHNRLLSVAEASALAGANAYSKGGQSAAIEQAKAMADTNNPQANLVKNSDVVFGEWKDNAFTVGGTVNAIRVTARRTDARGNTIRTFMASMFGVSEWNVANSAVAMISSDPICILILHPTHSDAFDIDPDARIDAPDCRVHVNSNS